MRCVLRSHKCRKLKFDFSEVNKRSSRSWNEAFKSLDNIFVHLFTSKKKSLTILHRTLQNLGSPRSLISLSDGWYSRLFGIGFHKASLPLPSSSSVLVSMSSFTEGRRRRRRRLRRVRREILPRREVAHSGEDEIQTGWKRRSRMT